MLRDGLSFSPPLLRATTEIYDLEKGSWTLGNGLAVARSNHTATLLNDGTVLVTGGYTHDPAYKPLASVEIFGPPTAE